MQALKFTKQTEQTVGLTSTESSSQATGDRKISVICLTALAAIFTISAIIRLPAIGLYLPYLYQIDEAPAFNWTVNIIKTGTFDPGQFIKPALPYYSMFPAIGIGFLKSVEKGEARKFNEIKTVNPYGDGGHEYTVSHPTVIKYARAWCIFVSLCLLLVVFHMGRTIESSSVGIIAAFFLALSPAHLVFSPMLWFISDMLVSIFACLSVMFSLKYYRSGYIYELLIAGAMAGLAVSSKYNAFLVVLVPLLAWTAQRVRTNDRSLPWEVGIGLVIVAAGISFVAGSPYTLLSFNDFLDGAAWQVWAYKHAWSDVEHSYIGQVTHFTSWLASSGVGYGVLLTGAIYTFVALTRKPMETLLIVLYPLTLFLYMSGQKINYVQNMLPIIPFLCLLAALLVSNLGNYFERVKWKRLTPILCSIVIASPIFLPFWAAAKLNYTDSKLVDSRSSLKDWVLDKTSSQDVIALSGELLFPHELRGLTRTREITASQLESQDSLLELWSRGDSYLAIPSWALPKGVEAYKRFNGFPGKQRIIRNPEIDVVNLSELPKLEGFMSLVRAKSKTAAMPNWSRKTFSSSLPKEISEKQLPFENTSFELEGETKKGYYWLDSRYTSLDLEKPFGTLEKALVSFVGFSPWKDQKITIFVNELPLVEDLEIENLWKTYKINIPSDIYKSLEEQKSSSKIEILLSKTGKLSAAGINEDSRQLGLALHDLSLQ